MNYQKQNQVSTPEKSTLLSACDCASAPVWMTELFDGISDTNAISADSISANSDSRSTPARLAAARAHMKSCTSCQRVWREWSRTRALLREVAAPAMPPALMEQVLLSCRMLPSQDAAAQSALENEIAHEELARYFNAPEAEYSAAFAPPLAAFFEEKAVPAQMKSQILQQVFEVSAQAALQAQVRRERVRSAQTVFAMPAWQNLSDSATNLARDWSLPRAGRWSFALAVPALAAWVLMVSPPSNVALAPIPVSSGSAPSTLQSAVKSSAANSSFNASFFQNLLPDIANRIAASPALSKPKATIAVKPTETKDATEIAAAKTTLADTTLADTADETVLEERPLASTIAASVPSQFAPRFASYSPPQPTVNPTIAPKEFVIKKSPIVRKINTHKTPMLDMARSRQMSQPSVSFSDNARLIAASMLKRLPSNDERPVATMQNIEERKAAPTLIASTMVGFDEAFESMGRLNDDRPAEVGKAFDDYRASLMSQNNGDQFSDEDLDDQL